VFQSLTERKEWEVLRRLAKAESFPGHCLVDGPPAERILPAGFAIAMGVLVGAVQRGDPLADPLAFAGSIFVLLQVLSPIHQAVSATWATALPHGSTTGSPRLACARRAWGTLRILRSLVTSPWHATSTSG